MRSTLPGMDSHASRGIDLGECLDLKIVLNVDGQRIHELPVSAGIGYRIQGPSRGLGCHGAHARLDVSAPVRKLTACLAR